MKSNKQINLNRTVGIMLIILQIMAIYNPRYGEFNVISGYFFVLGIIGICLIYLSRPRWGILARNTFVWGMFALLFQGILIVSDIVSGTFFFLLAFTDIRIFLAYYLPLFLGLALIFAPIIYRHKKDKKQQEEEEKMAACKREGTFYDPFKKEVQ